MALAMAALSWSAGFAESSKPTSHRKSGDLLGLGRRLGDNFHWNLKKRMPESSVEKNLLDIGHFSVSLWKKQKVTMFMIFGRSER